VLATVTAVLVNSLLQMRGRCQSRHVGFCKRLSARFQSGFRSLHSTETVVVKIANDVLSFNDSGKVTALVLLDLSAAFDSIDHEILLGIVSLLTWESQA